MTTSETSTASERRVLLEVSGLKKQFPVRTGFRKKGFVSAVDGVSFTVREGTTLGVVGESGCGKSTAARLILGLIKPDEGRIMFDGIDVQTIGGRERKALKRNMQMVFQDPYSALNPRASVHESISFPMRVQGYSRAETRERVPALLESIHDKHVFVRFRAMQSLGALKDRRAVPALCKAVIDLKDHEDTREQAAKALGKIGDPAAVDYCDSKFARWFR